MKRKAITLVLILALSSVFMGCEKQKQKQPEETNPSEALITDAINANADAKSATATADNDESLSDTSVDTTETAEEGCVQKDSRLFYYNSTDSKLYYVDKKVPVKENAYVKALTEAVQKTPDESFVSLPTEASITSANLDNKTGILKIVFSQDFTTAADMATASESGLLDSIACTYGYNYKTDKVAIYFGDKLYEGPNNEQQNGYFTVKTDDAVQFNKN